MKENIIEILVKNLRHLLLEIKKGNESNMNNLDGWSMEGLKNKVEEIKVQLKELGYILENDDTEEGG
jgi:hypothetical protein